MLEPASTADADLLCPQCGYDLRGIVSDHCPECGFEIDRSADRTSRIPWAHRRERGRIRAYTATVWLVMRRPRQLLNEVGWPVSYRDARRFWFVTAALLYVPMLLIAAGLFLVAASGVIEPKASVVNAPADWLLALQWDVAVPTVAGWMFTPLTALLVGIATLSLGAALPWLMNRPSLMMPHRARAVALAYYAAAPAAVLPLGLVAAVAVGLVRFAQYDFSVRYLDAAALAAAVAAAAAVVVTAIFIWLRAVQFYCVLSRGGAGRWVAGAILLPAAWALMLAFWLAAVPWAAGACWLLWRGLR